MSTCSRSAAVFGRTPVNLPVSSRTGTVPRLLMLMLRPRPKGTAPALTGRLREHSPDHSPSWRTGGATHRKRRSASWFASLSLLHVCDRSYASLLVAAPRGSPVMAGRIGCHDRYGCAAVRCKALFLHCEEACHCTFSNGHIVVTGGPQTPHLPAEIAGLSLSGELSSCFGVVVRCRRDPASARGASAPSSHVRGFTILPRLLVSCRSGGVLGSSSSPEGRFICICAKGGAL